MDQAQHFLEESQDLDTLIRHLSDEELEQVTAFKSWRISTVIRHLHFWNQMALYALQDGARFKQSIAPAMDAMQSGATLAGYEATALPVSGSELVALWRETYGIVADAYASADPAQRCTWAGPSMSARSCITARQMETWAHGQEVYDCLGRTRVNTDRLLNVVVLGINTYGWTFQVRGQDVPEPKPYVELIAPSGELWQFGDPKEDHRIAGDAEAFAQVVTQTRNVADTRLVCEGSIAERWMQNAQCFYGGPTEPPAPGTRQKRAI